MRVIVETGKECDVTLMDERVDFAELRAIVDLGDMKVSLNIDGSVTVVINGCPVCHMWLDENGEIKQRQDHGLDGEYKSLAMKAAITALPMVKALRELRVGVNRMARLVANSND